MEFLQDSFYGNPIQIWLLAVAIAVVSFFLLLVIKKIVQKRLQVRSPDTASLLDDQILDLIQRIKLLFLVVLAIYAGSFALSLTERANQVIRIAAFVVMVFQAGLLADSLIDFFLERYRKRRWEKDAASVTTMTALSFLIKIALWSIIVLLVLDNMGVNITGLIAGLGISGIAIALAVQNILGDLFASMSIVLDKPFVIGDFIIVDDYLGTVQHIGLKTTRIQSLSGEQLIFSNSDLLRSRIRNYKRMYERRIVFGLGVTYQTSHDKLSKIPGIIRDILEKQDKARLDRVHFKEFGNFSLNYEIVYYVLSPDYNVYMDIQQAINLEIFKRFQDESIEFAYPTQTLYLPNQAKPEDTESSESS